MKSNVAVCLLLAAANCIFAADTQQLKYVVIVSRHGVRSPTWTKERLNQYSSAPWPDWGVAPGELTGHGRELMKLMGSFYRQYFLAQGLPIKLECSDVNQVYFRADSAQRTTATAQALAEGILPGCTVAVHSEEQGQGDPLFEGAPARDPEITMAAVAARLGPKMESITDAHRASLATLDQILRGGGAPKRLLFDDPTTLALGEGGVKLSGPLSVASTLSEDLLLEYANGMQGDKLGWGRLTEANLLQVMSLHTSYAELMRRTPVLARRRGSNLLSAIVRSLQQAKEGKLVTGAIGPAGTKLLAISGHDTNLSNLSGMLELSWLLPTFQPDDAPPGGALLFSLWKASLSGDLSVRVQFIAQTMTQMHDSTALSPGNPPAIANVFVPGCSAASEGYPCSWDKFLKVAQAAIDPSL